MQLINNILDSFDPISLEQMDSVRLMNRTDTKFVFELELLGKVLNEIKEHYFVLDINGARTSAYRSLYFDTEDFEFYFEHHNGKTNRNKVRYREYIDSGLCFLEIKHKTNKGKTIKKRVKVDKIPDVINADANEFITSIIGEEKKLVPKHWNRFNRLTLVNKKLKERLTFDININFEGDNKTSELENMVIAEVKQEKINYASPFMRIIKKNRVRPFRISKYCMATASLYPLLKNNNFKPKFLKINKLQHHE
ncbi:polyphosphate polymerase domain-containing protein [bacterium]|nr:polyphosphate polymerase domain-containing protein [Flavobacteriales bacterium]MDA7794343.1 polyphosphate polymerase domain-containing protein [Flavobacteriales bacterium]MDA8963582.1 polyphosphate polymerase domain-containing protein [bacterium]